MNHIKLNQCTSYLCIEISGKQNIPANIYFYRRFMKTTPIDLISYEHWKYLEQSNIMCLNRRDYRGAVP